MGGVHLTEVGACKRALEAERRRVCVWVLVWGRGGGGDLWEGLLHVKSLGTHLNVCGCVHPSSEREDWSHCDSRLHPERPGVAQDQIRSACLSTSSILPSQALSFHHRHYPSSLSLDDTSYIFSIEI